MHGDLHLESPKVNVVLGALGRHFDDLVDVGKTRAANPGSRLKLLDVMIPGELISTEHEQD